MCCVCSIKNCDTCLLVKTKHNIHTLSLFTDTASHSTLFLVRPMNWSTRMGSIVLWVNRSAIIHQWQLSMWNQTTGCSGRNTSWTSNLGDRWVGTHTNTHTHTYANISNTSLFSHTHTVGPCPTNRPGSFQDKRRWLPLQLEQTTHSHTQHYPRFPLGRSCKSTNHTRHIEKVSRHIETITHVIVNVSIPTLSIHRREMS